MANTVKKVLDWRRRTKERMVNSFGGKCGICKQTFPNEVFDFHHLNPEEKELKLTSLMVNGNSWEKIVKELKKCVMLCANCHRQVHSKHLQINEDIIRFDESFTEYKKLTGV